ncbi:MAG: hypothetical protein LQ343_003427 [Gyalolechia ehrenbergii]|nr:MAG: hypothetical protein LQ343_003427 [Gyalolechia ehrenbergii]
MTSSTTLPPPPPPPAGAGGSTVLTTYTTAGSGGSATVVTSSTTIVPPPAGSTAVSTFVTTNSQGSSITTTGTSVIPPPASSGTPSPPSYSAACAGSQSYSDSLGFVWHVDCGIDYPGYDLPTISVSSFELCLQSCDNYVPNAEVANGATCVAISYGARDNGGECYLKYRVSETRYFPGFDSANKGGPNVIPQAPTSFSVIPESTPAAQSTTVIVQSSTNIVNQRPGVCRGLLNDIHHVYAYRSINNCNCPVVNQQPGVCSGLLKDIHRVYACRSTANCDCPIVNQQSGLCSGVLHHIYRREPQLLGIMRRNLPSSTSSPPSDRATLFQPCPLSNGQQFIDRSGTVYDVTCSCEYPGYDLTTPHYDAFQDCINACDNYVPDPNVAGGQDCVAATWSYGNPGGNCFLKYAIGDIIYGNQNDCSVKLHNYTIPNSASSTSTSVALTSTSSSSIVTSPPVPATATTSDNTPATTVPPQISNTATCPADRGAIYTDTYGQTYEIHCGQQVDGDNALSAFHADSFERCVNICEVLGGCHAVTYPGDTGSDISRSNCYPYTSFRFYSQQAVTDTLLSARVTNGSTSTAFANSVQLCPDYANSQFTEPIGKTYTIACEQGFSGTADLYSTVMYTLQACAAYCSLYNTCVAVTFTGYSEGSRNTNCFLRTTVGTLVAGPGQSAAYIAA